MVGGRPPNCFSLVVPLPQSEEWSFAGLLLETQNPPDCLAGGFLVAEVCGRVPQPLFVFNTTGTSKISSPLLTKTLATPTGVLSVWIINLKPRLLQRVVVRQRAFHEIESRLVVYVDAQPVVVGLDCIFFLGRVPAKLVSKATTASADHLNSKTRCLLVTFLLYLQQL